MAAAGVSPIAGKAGPGLSRELAARVVLCYQLDVSILGPPVLGLVLNPQIRQLEVSPHHRQVVRVSKREAIGREVRVSVAIVAIQESLVVALQFVVEHDTRDAAALALDAGGLLLVDAIDLRVMPELARLRNASVVLLSATVRAGGRVRVQQVLAVSRQRDDMPHAAAVDEAFAGHETLIGQMTPVA